MADWLIGNGPTILVALVLAAVVFFALRGKWKKHSCGCGCANCQAGCGKRTAEEISPGGKRRKTMKLTQTQTDFRGKVSRIGGDTHFIRRVTSIGITEGTAFQTVRNDPKMPVLLYCRGSLIALNRSDAEKIEVDK